MNTLWSKSVPSFCVCVCVRARAHAWFRVKMSSGFLRTELRLQKMITLQPRGRSQGCCLGV